MGRNAKDGGPTFIKRQREIISHENTQKGKNNITAKPIKARNKKKDLSITVLMKTNEDINVLADRCSSAQKKKQRRSRRKSVRC